MVWTLPDHSENVVGNIPVTRSEWERVGSSSSWKSTPKGKYSNHRRAKEAMGFPGNEGRTTATEYSRTYSIRPRKYKCFRTSFIRNRGRTRNDPKRKPTAPCHHLKRQAGARTRST